jgi:hypothetical protein
MGFKGEFRRWEQPPPVEIERVALAIDYPADTEDEHQEGPKRYCFFQNFPMGSY